MDEQISGRIRYEYKTLIKDNTKYRERLLVSYYRYSGEAGHNSHLDTVCELLRSTGFQPELKRPAGYPESLLARVSVQKSIVSKVTIEIHAIF